jgi:acyl-coenzyme A thioesterase PaaI-like protein
VQFRALRIRVIALDQGWRQVRILLPLAGANRNPGGGMFGGAVAALADPIPALACNRVFPGHAVWTRAMSLDFRREGRSQLELRFMLTPEFETEIRAELGRRGRSTPTFEYGFWDAADRLCVQVKNTVAIRPAGYIPPNR